MLIDGRCSIYEHRPRTCRAYDCRVFPAAGIDPDDKPAIARQTRRWQFAMPTDDDRVRLDAVRAAARFLGRRSDLLPGGTAVTQAQRAVLAIEIHDLFLHPDPETGEPTVVEPDPAAIRAALTATLADELAGRPSLRGRAT